MYEGLFDTRKGLQGTNRVAVGAMTARLILPWNHWVHRRVERIEFCDVDAARRKVSIDFTLPYWFHRLRGSYRSPAAPQSLPQGNQPNRHLVPLGFLRKGALVNFSLKNESGAGVPLLTTPQNAQVAEALLYVLASAVLREEAHPDLQCSIRQLVRAESGEDGDEALHNLFNRTDGAARQGSLLRHDLLFSPVARLFSAHWLALSMLDVWPHQRRIIHMSYEESQRDTAQHSYRTAGFHFVSQLFGAPRIFTFPIPEASNTDSYHAEIEAPDELLVTARERWETPDPVTRPARVPKRGSVKRAHLHFRGVRNPEGVSVSVKLFPRSSTIIRGALFAGLLVVAALGFVAWRIEHLRATVLPTGRTIEDGGHAATAATLLLATIGLGGLLWVRQTAHAMATSLLLPVRMLAATPVACGFLGSIAIVCDFSSQTTRWILVGLGAVALLCVFLLANLWRVTSAASRR